MQEKIKESSQEKKDSTKDLIIFSFLNEKKDSLVSLPVENEKINPKLATYAIINNKMTPIIYSATKPESEASNGRQTSFNFSNNGGDFFIIKEKINEGDFALLVNQKFIDDNKFLPFKKTEKETSHQTKTTLSNKYNRHITKSLTIAELNNQDEINLTLFEVKNDSALAVLSYLHNNQIITLDFPAKYDEMSTWRVDDGGIFDFENLQVLSIFQSGKSIKIATVFWGAEGYNLNFYESTAGVFKSIAEAYGYSAPQ
ncbi:hypothetical protein ACFX5U_03025 [Sphingobacterium sp. SG20118]|uniref:hypothetical protein n=1 Tax=Sphingobacterium sp. SG20118 TaxID=3367156 RepID=UPI0037DFC020